MLLHELVDDICAFNSAQDVVWRRMYAYRVGVVVDLDDVREDFRRMLSLNAADAHVLREAIVNGWVDGNATDPTRRNTCLYGHLARVRRCRFEEVPGVVKGECGPYMTEFEIFINRVRPGDTPENNGTLAKLLSWLDEYTKENP